MKNTVANNRHLTAKSWAVALGLMAFALSALASSKSEDVEVPTSPKAGKGFWMGTFATATNYAHTARVPIVLVWSKSECDYCNTLKTMFLSSEYQTWMASQPFAFCLVEGSASWADVGVNAKSGAKDYIKSAGGRCEDLGWTPYVSLIWERSVGDVAVNFSGHDGKMLVRGGSMFNQFTKSVEQTFADYRDNPVGEFACGNTVGDRLEAEIGSTTYVDVPLKRDGGEVTKDVLTWTYGGFSGCTNVVWSAGETARMVRVSTDYPAATTGEVIRLTMSRAGVSEVTTNAITFVERENSPKNPLWLGARDAVSLGWGEWTMDIDVATNRVARHNATNRNDRAYTLVLVAGGLWCPDCARNDRYVIDTPEFKQWTTDNRVACVCIDIPSDPTVGGPCLLSRDVREVSAKYRDADPEHGTYQSGTGYLSRWMISDADAAAVMERNAKFVGVNTLNGGWNRPERANQKRTGVPIFILLREDGSIAGRIETFATTSPGDSTYIRGYIRRLSELLTTIDDPDEESNYHPLTTRMALNAAFDVAAVVLSGADQADTFELTNVVDFTRLSVTANGATFGDLENSLSVWCITNGVASVVASQTGRLSDGALTVSADLTIPNARYFVRTELAGLGDLAVFGQDLPLVKAVTLTTALAYVPGRVAFDESEQEVSVVDGEGTVSISRTDGMSGIASAIVYVADPGSAAGCYAFTETNLVWAAGEVGSKEVSFTVFRNEGFAEGSFVLGLKTGPDNIAEISSDKLTIELQDTTDPTFEDLEIKSDGYSQFASVEVLALRNIDTSKSVRLKKVDGSLPSGMTLKYDRTLGAAVLSGTPKTPDVYTATYTVTQDGVTGLPAKITIVVSDPQDQNEFVNEKREKQVISLFAASGTNNVLAGTLTLSISSKNKITASYSGTESKKISFSGYWQTIEAGGQAYALLEKNGNQLELGMDTNGAVAVKLQVTPDYCAFAGEDDDYVTLSGDCPYPASDYADWAGYYTVTFVDADGESAARVEPFGTAYLALTVKDTGKVSWRGVLADGTSVSGTSYLDKAYVDSEKDSVAEVGIFKRTSKYVFGVKLTLKANSDRWYDDTYAQMIHHVAGAPAYVLHRESKISYYTQQSAYGGWYERSISPLFLCTTFGYDEEDIRLVISTDRLAYSERYGAPLSIDAAQLVATEKSLVLEDAPDGMRFSFKKSDGTFSGSAKLFFDSGKSVKGMFKGILMPGWSGCGQCVEGRVLVDRPFGSGMFYFKDIVDGKTVVRSCPVDLQVKTKAEAQ